MKRSDLQSLMESLKILLRGRKATTQEAICVALEKEGYEINQSKASRLLRKVGAAKVINAKGETVYSLPREPAPPSMKTALGHLVLEIDANESLVVIYTSPGSASLIARVLDYHQSSLEILGTIAGDDTIFVAPRSTQNTSSLFQEIRKILKM